MSTTGRNQSTALSSGVESRIAEISGYFFEPINFTSNKICVDLYSAGGSFFPFSRGALLDERNPKSGPAGTIEREERKRSSGIDNFARDAAAIVPNFINSEYAHQRAPRPSLLKEKMNEAKEDREDKEEGGKGVDRIGTKEDSRFPTASGLALLYYAERSKTKRQDTSRKPLKSLPDERPVIKTKSKRREGRDDVNSDLDDEEGKEEMKKGESAGEKKRERGKSIYRKREKKTYETCERDDRLRSTRSVNNTKADCGRG